jgi:hypothetical protein
MTVALAFATASASAMTVTIDEQGNGTIVENDGTKTPLVGSPGKDSGPGGLSNVLLYQLGLVPVAGDVLLTGIPGSSNSENFSDIVRFNADGTIAFYSDTTDGAESGDIADTPTPPQAIGSQSSWDPFHATLYGTQQKVKEVSSGGMDGAVYTPANADQPGFISSDIPVTYHIISDTSIGRIPEPSTWTMMILAFAALGFVGYRRRRHANVPINPVCSLVPF